MALRYGWRSARLTVYPPGTSAAQRRVLWLDRSIFIIAATLVILAVLVLAHLIAPLGLLLLILVGVAIIAIVRRYTRPLRATVRILSVAQLGNEESTHTYGDSRLLNHCVDELADMDSALHAGQITAVEYERRWGLVYNALSDEPDDNLVARFD